MASRAACISCQSFWSTWAAFSSTSRIHSSKGWSFFLDCGASLTQSSRPSNHSSGSGSIGTIMPFLTTALVMFFNVSIVPVFQLPFLVPGLLDGRQVFLVAGGRLAGEVLQIQNPFAQIGEANRHWIYRVVFLK